MHIVQFVHPDFLVSQSMPRFAQMIARGMRARGHHVDTWSAEPLAYRVPAPTLLKKWLGYIDQLILFPLQLRWRVRQLPADTLFVFADQALGPWVPGVANRPHVIHVHDFLALCSALGEVAENPTGFTGRQYQALIRRGFSRGRRFVSVSENTRTELHRFLPQTPEVSEVIYNGLNFPFRRMSPIECAAALSPAGVELPRAGFLLHVGGNQWYKNRKGVLEIYLAYVQQTADPLPLWMVGAPPSPVMSDLAKRVAGKGEVRFFEEFSNEQVCAVYSSARLLLFPSLAEGFGWPIAEAMACGCLVLTTSQAPMTEVGGDAAFYVPPRSLRESRAWAVQVAARASKLLALSPEELNGRRQLGFNQVARFDAEQTLDAYERIYKQAIDRRVQ